jgi:hypothetical protein
VAPAEPFQCGAQTGSPATWREFSKARKRFLKPTIASQSWVFCFLANDFDWQTILKGNMKQKYKKYKQVRTRFEPETRFEVGAVAPVPFRGALETELEQLKARLLGPLLDASAKPEQSTPLRQAANEAAGLAWFTPFPLLFFPALLEEKVYAAQRQEARQRQIRQQTKGLLEKAVA